MMAQQNNKAALAEQWAKNFFSGNVESKSEEWTYRTGTLACIKGTATKTKSFSPTLGFIFIISF
jgi:hypothetical protein